MLCQENDYKQMISTMSRDDEAWDNAEWAEE
jgi:hypothetical protein